MNFGFGSRARLLLAVNLLMATAAASQTGASYKTTIAPAPGENLGSGCLFDLFIPAPNKPVRAVWLAYNRGYDVTRYFDEPDVIAFAGERGLALLLAHQCPAKNPPTGEPGEMDMDPAHGIARTISAALAEFAAQSQHPELAHAKLVLLGFSGTGALFAGFIKFAPDRAIAAILANAGQTPPWGIESVQLSGAALRVPELVIAGGADDRAGAERPYDYFSRHRAQGAPWAFVVQNAVPHCCVINLKPFVLEWLGAVLNQPDLNLSNGWLLWFRKCPSTRNEQFGRPLWDMCDAKVTRAGAGPPPGLISAGWLPTRHLAAGWLAFVRQNHHPVNSFPDGKDADHSEFSLPKH